ncbi:DNA/RNA nuclease SfsA [Natronincola ferrireducens]|uniref:Sugar fermentation stimulation protein homolog n=1 Tax=Natronincola ferrireducens TaxID=393762 RepID=A0A1G9CNE3_9FIRM|nr:DNA/RNA nuclease SfsA [Natronincola ferrireducens]SDK53213.1 sugar fermentation stimulation protein A [Natronincola ferrireducens]
MKINIEGNKVEGVFQRRLNRFIGEVLIDDKLEITHIPNTGRMKDFLTNGANIILRKVNEPHRKTQYDLLMVYKDNTLINIDSKLPNNLLHKAFLNKDIEGFQQYDDIRREVTFGNSKFDFYLSNKKESVLVEAKCVTLVKENHLASFPDAPTDRGTKHILELIEAKKQGFRTAVFFIIQRDDANKFTPNQEMDEAFYKAVLLAKKVDVEFYAYTCHVTPNSLRLKNQLEIIL